MPRLKCRVQLTERQKQATPKGDGVEQAINEARTRSQTALERYRYDRAREAERELKAAARVAAWAAGYKTRLARRIKAGFYIPKSAYAGTGLYEIQTTD